MSTGLNSNPADAMSEQQTFRSERSLSLRLIRLRRKWVSASERTSIIGGLGEI
jgi:hypothetical protein